MKKVLSLIKKLRIRNVRKKIFWSGMAFVISGILLMMANLVAVTIETTSNVTFFYCDIPLKMGILLNIGGFLMAFELIKKKGANTNRP